METWYLHRDGSYVTQSGDSTVRRNRQFLKPTEAQEKQHADVNASAMECNHNEIPGEAVIPEQTPSSGKAAVRLSKFQFILARCIKFFSVSKKGRR